MSVTISTILEQMTGDWSGTNLLRLMPDQEYVQSDARATIALAARGNVATINNTWADDGKPQDGVLLITHGNEPNSVSAIWVDSWHQHPQWMELHGAIDGQRVMLVEAQYGSEDQPWRWRIHVDASSLEHFRLRMDNGNGDMDYQAVEANYSRAG